MRKSIPRSKPAKWTLMVYLAGDSNLEAYGVKDLGEMSAIGSSDEVAVVAQFGRMSDRKCRRYYITAPAWPTRAASASIYRFAPFRRWVANWSLPNSIVGMNS